MIVTDVKPHHRSLEARTDPLQRSRSILVGDHAPDGHCCQVASTITDRLRAWHLAYRVYREKGYAEQSDTELWYGPHDGVSGTTTFVVEHGTEPVAACTMVRDSREMGLPADSIYRDELTVLRDAGRQLCEMTSLVNTVSGRSGQEVLRHMFLNVYLTSRCLDGATDLVITVNPRHQTYYERALLFERIGDERDYGRVSGAPAVFMRLDYETMAERYARAFAQTPSERSMYRLFFGPDGYDHLAWIASQRRPLEASDVDRWFGSGMRGCA